jgi:hypothetical protein
MQGKKEECRMHYAKYQKGAVGSILLHSDRGIDSPDTHEHSNESIDKTRTHLNYDLKDRGGLTAYEYYKKRIDDIASETKERTGKSIRKDAVTLCSWAVTAPKDLPEEKLQDFFKASYAWFAERYGADNIVTAAVHMDESTPHMHLQFTPIIEKDGVRKLCAKDMETRKTLSTAHQKLQKHLEQALGCEVNILNGATEKGNRSVLELQNETLRQQIEERSEQYEKMTKTLSSGELKEIDVTPKRLTGGFKGLSPKQAQELVNTSTALSKENRQLKKENKQLKEKNKELKSDSDATASALERMKQERQAVFSREKLQQAERERKQKEHTSRVERERDALRDYMSQLKFSDGSTALEQFERLKRSRRRENKEIEL